MSVNAERVWRILRDVNAPCLLNVGVFRHTDRLFLQVEPNGRKWALSEHMTPSEIVRTAFMAALAYEEHELRESFTYKGVAIFGPHLDVEDLAKRAPAEDRRHGTPGAWEREA